MKIYIGADHRGYNLKKKTISFLKGKGHDVEDVGSHRPGVRCDYPKIARALAKKVAAKKESRGILVCMTGIGHAIAANKVKGVYAALCYNKSAARLAREHNNTNVLVLGSRFVPAAKMRGIITTWLNTKFAGGRHLRRVNQIKRMEK